jgi:hypothetical protein
MVDFSGERLRKLGSRYPIDDDLVFGLDVGIASIGSGVVRRVAEFLHRANGRVQQ